jgi:hypothetical protein
VLIGVGHHPKSRGEMGASAPSTAMGVPRHYLCRSSRADQTRRPCGSLFRRCAVVYIAAASLLITR